MNKSTLIQWVIIIALAAIGLYGCNDTGSEGGSDAPAASSQPAATPPPSAATDAPAADPADDSSAAAEHAEDGSAESAEGEGMDETAGDDVSADAAMEIFAANNCAMCHGKDMGGNKMGPALTGLSDYWDAESLVAYMKNPEDRSVNEEHLAKLDEEYSLTMPAFEGSDDDLKVMVEYLLSK